MTDVDDDLQAAFDRLRRDVSGMSAGPHVGEVVRRGRRRRRTRAAVARVVTAAVALGALLSLPAVWHPRDPADAPKALSLTDLVYGSAARGDPAHWGKIEKFPGEEPPQPSTPACGRYADEQWPENGPMAHASGYDISYSPDPKDSDRQRGEQVLALTSAKAARRAMVLVLRHARACGGTAAIGRPAIGNEALSVSHSYLPAGAALPATENAMVVRQGGALAVYWDYHGGGAPALTTMARHERDARTTAARLCDLGYGC